MRIVLISGVSGAGKSVALKVLEDSGYYCIDNLPPQFLPEVIAHLETSQAHVAVAIDARSGAGVVELPNLVAGLRTFGSAERDVRVLFLTASTRALVQRYSETRRSHPMSHTLRNLAGGAPALVDAIEHERELVVDVAQLGVVLDTTDLAPSKLRAWIKELVELPPANLTLMFESFGFKHGVPLNADLVFDVRCLPNPFYDLQLRPLTGRDQAVIEFLEVVPEAQKMYQDIQHFVNDWLPSYVRDSRSYLTVAIGCTGGQHRSVWMCEKLAQRFHHHPLLRTHERQAVVVTHHRELALG